MQQLRYQPLLEGEIRLLRILATEDLTCELIHAVLDEAPCYSALSYTWGQAIHPAVLPVNDQGLVVHANLHDALMHIGIRLKGSKRLLWVDAICINQEDLQERSSQVTMMKAIYEGASTVGVWLGRPDNEIENQLAVKKMEELNAILRETQGDVMAANTSISADDRRIFDHPGSECYQAWLGILSIMRRRWWCRTWVFQEATVPEPAGSDITWFFSGMLSFPWPYIAAAITIMHNLERTLLPENPTFLDINYGPARHLLRLLIERERGRPLQLLDLLRRFRESDATDPRDKVYAALGLAADVPPNTILPDYSKPVEVVYLHVVECMLTRERHQLDFLGLVVRTSPNFNHVKDDHEPLGASWIPDWRNHINLPPFPKVMKIRDPVDGEQSESAVYNAGGALPVNASITGLRLKVHGCHVDTIHQLSSYWQDDADPSTIRDWKPETMPDIYPTGERTDAVLLRTVVADVERDFDGNVARNHSMDWTNFGVSADRLTEVEYKRQDRMLVAVNSASYGRRLCWTREGYIGITPAVSEVGDKICAFFGGQVLYVLREIKPSMHEFVGECYIHGLMDGEIIQWVKDGLKAAETFTIM